VLPSLSVANSCFVNEKFTKISRKKTSSKQNTVFCSVFHVQDVILRIAGSEMLECLKKLDESNKIRFGYALRIYQKYNILQNFDFSAYFC
jgi:hypothetical protein